MMPYLFKIGSFELRIYSLMYIIGLLLTIYFCKRRAKSLGVKPEIMENLIIVLFISGLIGARLYYVLMKWDFYKHDLFEIFAIWHGGLAIHGGVIGGAIGVILYSARLKMRTMFTGDIIAPFLLFSQGIGRFGNFANGEAHGVPTITPPDIIFRIKPVFNEFWANTLAYLNIQNHPQALSKLNDIVAHTNIKVPFEGKGYILREYVPWGISFTSKYMPPAYNDFGTLAVHPTFFYEMILNFIGAAILFIFWKKDKYISSGFIFGMYLVFYGVIRSVVTMFRADDLMIGFMRAPHVAGLAFVIVGAVLIILSKKRIKEQETA